ncbi:ATP/GTP-binding protein [Plantactinospora siamensis]|uniref:ATP/GTP-binding protein n=1 Tax=Plantactinospora siamensis TaxID=555372 RepID=A0ABV6NYN8_9ACTN
MLLSFSFTNHRSFRDEQQLNLTPAYPNTEVSAGRDAAVRVVGIFGANASGKSNCLHALAFMRRLAIRSDREVEPGFGLVRDPFRLSMDASDAPSRYVVDLLLGGVRHTYGFALDDERVLEEWLYQYPHNRKRTVFDRDEDGFTWGEGSGRRGELERIADITAPTALFLSTVARFEAHRRATDPDEPQPLHETYRWFLGLRTQTRPGTGRYLRPDLRWTTDPDSRRVIVELLRAADVGIVDIALKKTDPDPTIFDPASFFDESIDNEGKSVGGMNRNSRNPAGRKTLDRRSTDQLRLQLSHRASTGDVLFDLHDESTGTQQLLALGVDAAAVLRGGGVMTVDEIDASLHPMLTAKLIGLFQNPVTNPLHSQLIFTSHDAALLGTFDTEEVLERDEIWFTQKDAEGASSLYPLTDFKPRKEGENRQRRYLNGNYGGIPDLSTYLFEQALATRGAANDQPKED